MTRGVDELVEFLLSEVALTGVQGAGSADFKRSVQVFYEQSQDEDASRPNPRPHQLGRTFYERIWHWVSSHADIRITHNGVLQHYSLAEFEAAENIGSVVAGGASLSQSVESLQWTTQKPGPAKFVSALRESMRQRLTKEGLIPQSLTAPAISTIQQFASAQNADSDRPPPHANRRPRALPIKANDVETIFDDPPTNTTAPRLYASQSRIWQALTGHGIDLKKVPTMEFILLSLIASHGVAGITQPDLTVMSGQDKRSVPHRTDELCRKGYIEKRPVQAGKLRTSLCVHKKFVSDDHFLTSGKVEDVFQYKKFVLSGFVHLLYNTLKDAGVVPTRDIRKRLNVPMSTWNKRAVQGALIRLDQTGMVKRFRARRKDAEDNWLTCIEVLREPRPEDHDNLKFRRQATMEEAADEQSDEDVDGDTLMRDLEVDMLNGDPQRADGDKEDVGRIPPQWVPERLLSNTLYDAIAMGGSQGCDSGILRDRIVGKFWRRPMESYLTRLTDDWEKTQPAHLRHLALIRDTRNTQEKKFVHYVYRTYKNFQKAVDAGEVIWAGVSKLPQRQPSVAKGGRPKKDVSREQSVDPWGFRTLNSNDFLGKDSSGTLSECREAIVHGRRYGPRWDNLLTDGIGYQKIEAPRLDKPKWTNDMSRSRARAKLNLAALATPRSERRSPTPTEEALEAGAVTESEHGTPVAATKVMGLPKRKHESGLLTIEQRIALGLKPKGRLSKFVEDQIREHRKRTGDPSSFPDSVVHEVPSGKPNNTKRGPLMTKEERIAAGLPARGRLGQKIEDQIREQRGLPKNVAKAKKPRNKSSNGPALLSKQQRIQFGIIPHGRLPQSLMEGLREEREFDIALERSKVIPAYLGAVEEKRSKAEMTRVIDKIRAQTLQQYDPSRELIQDDTGTSNLNGDNELLRAISRASTPRLEKRKADDDATTLRPAKRMRVERDATPEERSTVTSTPPSALSAGRGNVVQEQTEQDGTVVTSAEDEDVPAVAGASQQSSPKATTPPQQVPLLIDLAEVNAKVRLINEAYNNRSGPGIYTNPFAKRKITKGRPRNAFIATFRLERLSTLDWFIDDVIGATEKPAANDVFQSSKSVTVASPVAEQKVDIEDQTAAPNTESERRDSRPKLAVDIGAAVDVNLCSSRRDGSPPVKPSSVQEHDIAMGEHSDEQIAPDQACTPQDTVNEVERSEIDCTSEQGLNRVQTVQHHTRPVAGWNAINMPPPPLATYQSPYAASDQPEPTILGRASPASEVTEQAAQDSIGDNQIQGVCGPITEADTLSRSARKLAAYMGTKTGGGSQKIFRHKIILQIIDICNGVYPMHGEIGRPFVTLWKQQHPDTPPPNSSTVLSNLRDMIADPHSGLKKFSFLIRLRQSAGLKKKDMVVYQHLTPTSPQVTKLAYNMANYSNTKAHQYYPDEIRHLVSDESFYVPMPVAPKDETVSLERLNPSLQNKIKEANLERRRRYYHKQKNEDLARDAQNAGVEVPLRQATKIDGQPRTKRTRLASLNDKNKRYRRAPLSRMPPDPMEEELEESMAEEHSLPDSLPEHIQTLTWKEPWVASVVRSNVSLPLSKETTANAVQKDTLVEYYACSMTSPIVRFYATNGTFSTEFGLVGQSDLVDMATLLKPVVETVTTLKSKKRVRNVEPVSQRSNKKARLSTVGPTQIAGTKYVSVSDEETGHSQSSSTSPSSSDDDNVPLLQSNHAKAKAKAKAKTKTKANQRRSKKELPPTLLERLTGLTGDPNDHLYLLPKPKAHSRKSYKRWIERKRARFNKQQRDLKYAESHDPVDGFKRLCCALVIASSMTGKDGCVEWNIVERVHDTKGLDLTKTKALWTWMQTNMAPQLANLTADFQTRFLEAYENNRIAAIEDPESYDWANLVKWAMHTCVFSDLSLPVYQEALQKFTVDLSSFEVMDRPKWHREKIADRVRTQLQLQFPFTAPLPQPNTPQSSIGKEELKARSWIRANTATPQAFYDSKTAHEKLKTLGDPVLAKVVAEYVDRQMLRMRKLKRLLPGRNYTFTARLANKYGRTFELGDFMAAVKIKKEMDTAFARDNPEQRVYSISRAESDGATMVIMSLLSEGKVKFVPKLPPVNNEFGAPLPRLSVWGFMEGDYVHRGIDRQRLFWDIHVVPTATYDYGSPLQPSPTGQADSFAAWSPLTKPPLPGKQDSDALLPIWSSMDGQNVTWPWWYRILNLVLQPLIFQPGATVEDIHANCDEYTTEIFEIELVLQWLVSVNAVKTIGRGYVTLPGVWAAFGDVLYDMKNDWLNSHVKRKHRKHAQQQLHGDYDLRYSTLQGRSALRNQNPSDESDESDTQTDDDRGNDARPDERYAVLRPQNATAAPKAFAVDRLVDDTEQRVRSSVASDSDADKAHNSKGVATKRQGDEMEDASIGPETHPEGEKFL
ncbi:DNA binding [Ascochyta rabiei]|uniref:DNA binding n=1 Tax=Didymella rabiei TaxID=5454 RepID=A0A162W8J4_DIDRA|nr:DNA binding [Ascochyta rabiei]